VGGQKTFETRAPPFLGKKKKRRKKWKGTVEVFQSRTGKKGEHQGKARKKKTNHSPGGVTGNDKYGKISNGLLLREEYRGSPKEKKGLSTRPPQRLSDERGRLYKPRNLKKKKGLYKHRQDTRPVGEQFPREAKRIQPQKKIKYRNWTKNREASVGLGEVKQAWKRGGRGGTTAYLLKRFSKKEGLETKKEEGKEKGEER